MAYPKTYKNHVIELAKSGNLDEVKLYLNKLVSEGVISHTYFVVLVSVAMKNLPSIISAFLGNGLIIGSLMGIVLEQIFI